MGANTLHTTHYTLHTTHYTLHTTHYILHTAHYTLHTTHYPLHTTHYTLHTTLHITLHYTTYTLHTTLPITHRRLDYRPWTMRYARARPTDAPLDRSLARPHVQCMVVWDQRLQAWKGVARCANQSRNAELAT